MMAQMLKIARQIGASLCSLRSNFFPGLHNLVFRNNIFRTILSLFSLMRFRFLCQS